MASSRESSAEKTLADQFSTLWDAPPDVFVFLDEHADATLQQCAEVLAVDQFRRWRSGIGLPVECYFERLPQIATEPKLQQQLILREYKFRQLRGETLDPSEFANRFPKLRDRLLQELGGPLEQVENAQPEQMHKDQDAASNEPTIIANGDQASTRTVEFITSKRSQIRPAQGPATSLPKSVLAVVESQMFEQEFEVGEYLVRQGDVGSSLLVVCDGIVEITTTEDDGSRHFIGRLGKGQVLGEMSLLTAEPRTANALATTPVRAFVLPADTFHELAAKYSAISFVLTRLFATRLGGVGRDVLAGKMFGGYQFKRHLGQGGMAVVYEATDVKTGRRVALKMMSHRLVYEASALERFQLEADIIESFEHENIIDTYGRFSAFHTFFIAMQYCDGRTLEDVINAHRILPENEFRKIIGQVAAALDYAHAAKIIHRDVKPSNIMLNYDGQVKLMDFGLAKPVEETSQGVEGAIVGTPRYMAPEQLAGKKVSKTVDYFALGCVAYKMLTGNTLFSGSSLRELRREHTRWKLPDYRKDCQGISIATNWLLEQCLQKKSSHRRPNLKKIASWAAPFDTNLLSGVGSDINSGTFSIETVAE